MSFLRFSIGFMLWMLLSQSQADVAKHFESLKKQPQKLHAFLLQMPKGGELHYHLAGGANPEIMINLASEAPFCIDDRNHTASKSTGLCLDKPIKNLLSEPELYFDTIKAWSMADFDPTFGVSGHDHFFSTFYKFNAIVSQYRAELLRHVIERAASQNELYMEIMILPDNAQSTQFSSQIKKLKNINEMRRVLLQDPEFQKVTQTTVSKSHQILERSRELLGCNKNSSLKSCQMVIRFQYYILREQPTDQFIAQAIHGFEAASQSDVIVAVNVVQAEDDTLSMKLYQEQMQVLNQLHQLYPDVHISLHAGELTPDMLNTKAAKNHIFDAITIGRAERIGHGVSIQHEEKSQSLVKLMAKKQIPVEINLTSNEKILNVKDEQHPLPFYLKHHVPIVLSTDDEGILRTDLTREYVKLTNRYQMDYDAIKQINRNALTYSFLPGKSIWQNALKAIPVKECQNLDSKACIKWIEKSQKAQIQRRLEQQLAAFEKPFQSY